MSIKKIAEKVGVSQTTVINVINGKTAKMKRETYLKVEQAILEEGYVKRIAPMLLSGNGKRMLGIIVGEDEENPAVTSCGWMILDFEKEAYLRGYYVILHCSNNKNDIVEFIKTWNLSGIIYLSVKSEIIEEVETEYGVPFIARKILHKSDKREVSFKNAVKDFLKLLSDKTLLC